MFRKPVSGAGAGTVASMEKGGGTCWAGRTEDKPKKAATVMAASQVFILIIHQNWIDDSNGRNWRAGGIVFIQAEDRCPSAVRSSSAQVRGSFTGSIGSPESALPYRG
jgi:hypothetical protein